MKTYKKPIIEIINFRANEQIASSSIFDYTDESAVPVTMVEIQKSSWNGAPQS